MEKFGQIVFGSGGEGNSGGVRVSSWLTRGLLDFCVLLLASVSLFAQTGGIKGRVRNMNGSGIGGTTVAARQNGRDIRTTTTNEKGEFTLTGLADGTYNILFDAKGYNSGLKTNVAVKSGKVKDLGDRLILQVDRGALVIFIGSVYYKDGTSAPGARVDIEKVNGDGSVRKVGTVWAGDLGEFSYRQPEGTAKYRITATIGKTSASKDMDVDSAQIYRLGITVPVDRPVNP
ncbi:MAG: carboxypeptidase regulatory-like domain-containing protein [Acidobacteria bacterium]|nr:carboxypeptidase regulatory-like domain-containing protein [Acidobacteriota bacterium]